MACADGEGIDETEFEFSAWGNGSHVVFVEFGVVREDVAIVEEE